MDNPDLMKAMAYRDGGPSETVAETMALKGHEGLGDPLTGRPRSYEEKLAMENRKLANAPDDPNRKIFIRVPFKEKKVAIGFGAIFDTDRNRWCVTQEQAVALKDVEPFKYWLPEDALPARYRTKVNCSDKVVGVEREAFKRLTQLSKTATPEELRQAFAAEIMSCGAATNGEMWLEFKEAMAGDLQQRGVLGSEVAVVAEIDLLLMQQGKVRAPAHHTHTMHLPQHRPPRLSRRHALSTPPHSPTHQPTQHLPATPGTSQHLPASHLAGALRSRRPLGPPAGAQVEAAAAEQAAKERARGTVSRAAGCRRELSVCRDRRGGGGRIPAAAAAGRSRVARAGCGGVRGAACTHIARDGCSRGVRGAVWWPQRRGDGTRGACGAVR